MLLFRKLLDWKRMGKGPEITLEAGQTAPDFRMELVDGGSRSLEEVLSNGPALVAFYKVSCPTCQLTLPYLERLQGGGLQIFAVCQDEADRAQEFSEVFEVHLPNLLDRADEGYPVSNSYGITHVPTMFLIEPDRRISWTWTGFHKRQLEGLAQRAGKPIFRPTDNVPESKYG
ncbi:TlpA disulfide reductase family protein [uncultured Paludibaculum sp.]|uniref:peroxiredoxin family protein n=1 Tax=uncultured Paludibaculum sp. TaxID=1765020 RepID=UPI002AAB6EC5|nr:TlpA disulfide reductase family protein [uncultured Paludibaculum sp.]